MCQSGGGKMSSLSVIINTELSGFSGFKCESASHRQVKITSESLNVKVKISQCMLSSRCVKTYESQKVDF